MVVYALSVAANFDGVDSLQVNTDSICLDVKHPLDSSEVREKIVVDFSQLEEEAKAHHHRHHHHDPKHHEKPCHFQIQWSDGTRGAIRVLTEKLNVHHPVNDIQEWLTILSMECENVEPVRFYPLGNEFVVKSKAGTVYNEVDLSSGSWRQSDWSSGSTAITHFQSKLE